MRLFSAKEKWHLSQNSFGKFRACHPWRSIRINGSVAEYQISRVVLNDVAITMHRTWVVMLARGTVRE